MPGEEPGSANYASRFRKRSVAVQDAKASQSGVDTNLDMGKTMINYGSTLPYEALEHLRESCGGSACDTTGTKVFTKHAGEAPLRSFCWIFYQVSRSRKPLLVSTIGWNTCGPDDVELELKPQGQYSGDQERDNFIKALKAQVAQGIETKKVWWPGNPFNETFECREGEQDEHKQSNIVSANRSVDSNLQGFPSVEVQHGAEEDGNCGRVLDALGAAAGAINGIAGGFFGLLSFTCPE